MPVTGPKQHHYIPKHYLRSFCADDSPGLLWVYTKRQAGIYQAGIHNIAKENSFYLPEVEQALASDVESPAEPVLKKIRAHGGLVAADREILAAYLTILRKRVPAYRMAVQADAPEVLAQEFTRLKQEIVDQVHDPGRRAENLAEIAAIEEAWQQRPPPAVQRLAEQPWTTGEIEAQILRMHWYFLMAAGPSHYVSCDNPVFMFGGLGLDKPESELSCPISRDLAILVTGTARNWSPYIEASERWVQELNRRSVQNATSRVFYAKKATWLERMVQKPRLRLSRIGP